MTGGVTGVGGAGAGATGIAAGGDDVTAGGGGGEDRIRKLTPTAPTAMAAVATSDQIGRRHLACSVEGVLVGGGEVDGRAAVAGGGVAGAAAGGAVATGADGAPDGRVAGAGAVACGSGSGCRIASVREAAVAAPPWRRASRTARAEWYRRAGCSSSSFTRTPSSRAETPSCPGNRQLPLSASYHSAGGRPLTSCRAVAPTA